MQPVERIEIAKPMESKWIRADRLWDRIAGNAFFSTEEKLKIRLAIETEPDEDVKPVVHAYWIKGIFADITCSNCSFPLCIPDSVIPKMLYCPNCGAKMDAKTVKALCKRRQK